MRSNFELGSMFLFTVILISMDGSLQSLVAGAKCTKDVYVYRYPYHNLNNKYTSLKIFLKCNI